MTNNVKLLSASTNASISAPNHIKIADAKGLCQTVSKRLEVLSDLFACTAISDDAFRILAEDMLCSIQGLAQEAEKYITELEQ